MTSSPRISEVHTVTVSVRPTGPEADPVEGYEERLRLPVLADVEAWCEELRSRRLPGDAVVSGAEGLSVVIDLTGPHPVVKY